MNIGPKTIDKATELIGAMLKIHRADIDKAFLKTDGVLTVSLGVKFKPSEAQGEIEIESTIKFVTDQVKDSAMVIFNENQGELFTLKEEE